MRLRGLIKRIEALHNKVYITWSRTLTQTPVMARISNPAVQLTHNTYIAHALQPNISDLHVMSHIVIIGIHMMAGSLAQLCTGLLGNVRTELAARARLEVLC